MVTSVPSLTGSLYVTAPESIIALTLRRYMKTPKHTIPILPDLIISLPWVVARFAKSPDTLCDNIRSDLQGCLDRIFNGERTITVTVNNNLLDEAGNYEVNISIMYTTLSGELSQLATSISLGSDGTLHIPEDKTLNSYLV